MSNICQSFQTLYEASPIINVTHRFFAVFHPILYVTHRSFSAPAPAIRDFSGYTIHILYYAGVSIMPPRVLASGPKPCGGNKSYYALLYIATSFPGSLLFLAPGARKGCVMVTRSNKAKTAAHTYLK